MYRGIETYLINALTAVFSLFAFDFLMRSLDKNDAIASTTGKEYFLVAAVTVITTLQNSSTSLLLFCSIGYHILGWSESSTATKATYGTYSEVADSWIASKYPTVDLYAVWEPFY